MYEVINRRPPSAGDANVNIVSTGQSGRPIVLVLGSYEPVNWILNLPAGITISKVILVSIREKHLNQRSMSDTIWRRKKLVSAKTFAVYSQNLQLNNQSVPRKIKDVKLFYHLRFFLARFTSTTSSHSAPYLLVENMNFLDLNRCVKTWLALGTCEVFLIIWTFEIQCFNQKEDI